MELKDQIKHFLQLWGEFTWDKLLDPAYWMGWLSAYMVLFLVLSPAIVLAFVRGGFVPMVLYYSRIAIGGYYVRKRCFPNQIGAAQHILRRNPENPNQVGFFVDYTVAQSDLSKVLTNPYLGYVLLKGWQYTDEHDGLLRMNCYGPKNRRLKTSRSRTMVRKYSKKKKLLIRRYQGRYKSIQSMLCTLTNSGAVLASAGVPVVHRTLVIALTFAYFNGQDAYWRVIIIDEETLKRWPQQPLEELEGKVTFPPGKPDYKERFLFTARLARQYHRQPWRFSKLDLFLPVEQARQIQPLPDFSKAA